MKRFYIFSALFFLFGGLFSVYAQDLIILRDGNTIEAKVLEISPTEIRYKRFDHLDGPTVVVLAVNILSIRYENGRTEIINESTQPATVLSTNLSGINPRFNTFGGSVGYLGISNFGFSLNGTVSPAPYTFFDFNMGLGFSSFSFNGNAGFNGFVPFNNGGWYGGLGIGGGLYELGGSMNGYFAVNAITGVILFNWLNISATLQMEVVPEFNIRFKPMAGYVYRFKPRQDSVAGTLESENTGERGSSSVALKFSLGGVFGIFSWEATADYDNDNYDTSYGATYLNLINPIISLRLLFSFENRLRLGLGVDAAYALVNVRVKNDGGGYGNLTGTLAPYAIIGYGNAYLHAGYDFALGGLYISPTWAVNDHLLLGLPITLFGNNQGFSIANAINPPDQYDEWRGHYKFDNKPFQIGLSIQYVFGKTK